MIKRTGNLFDTTSKHIGHGVNTKGVMGAGIAVEFRNRFPKMYTQYKAVCEGGGLKPGGLFVAKEGGYVIHNIASQKNPGADARYVWLHMAAYRAAERVVEMGGATLAIPLIGCGIGGLEWSGVRNVLDLIETEVPMQFEVWKFEPGS